MLTPKRVLAPVAATLAAALMVPISAGPAQAASPITISGVQYDSPGSDLGGNRSLNAEWVRLTNRGSRATALTGWTLRDRANHVYRFGTFKLGAGKSVVIHTGRGTKPPPTATGAAVGTSGTTTATGPCSRTGQAPPSPRAPGKRLLWPSLAD